MSLLGDVLGGSIQTMETVHTETMHPDKVLGKKWFSMKVFERLLSDSLSKDV